MTENGSKFIIKADINEALSQIGTAFSIIGEKLRNCFIVLFPSRAEESYKRLYNNMLKEWEYTQEILTERQIPPKMQRKLSDKFGDAWIKNAPLEENQDLRRIWANLLANALDPNFDANNLRVSFTDIIKSLESLDVQILYIFYQHLKAENIWGDIQKCNDHIFPSLLKLEKVLMDGYIKSDILNIRASLDNLERNTLIKFDRNQTKLGPKGKEMMFHQDGTFLTTSGIMFITACIASSLVSSPLIPLPPSSGA
jgi:hypothetical protein